MAWNLNDKLTYLARLGCRPSIYFRGDQWRAHVNMAGNCWADADTPSEALRLAVRMWEQAGRPMDGRADEPQTPKVADQ